MNNIPLNDYLLAHCNESMERALAAERHPAWQRSCPEMNERIYILGTGNCKNRSDDDIVSDRVAREIAT